MMSELAIPPEMIERRLRNFWGYGSFKAPVWLIGMEEGLSDQGERELLIRFRATDNKAMVDMRRDMGECSDHMEWCQPHCEIQRTWRFPIALYLALTKGRNPDIEEIREYQRTMLGDTNLSQTAVIELMPLPSKWADEGAWLYGKYRSLGLKTREHYMQAYKQGRVRALGALIDTHKPKLVIFYGSSLHNDWLAVAQVPVTEISRQTFVGQSNNTSFCFIPHSRSRKPIPMSYTRVFFYADQIRNRVASLAPDLCPAGNQDADTDNASSIERPQKARQHISKQVEAQPTDIMRMIVNTNPKLPGSKTWKRFNLYRDGMSISNYIDAVGKRYGRYEAHRAKDDIEWDSERKFIQVERGGRPVNIYVRPSYRNPRE